MWPDTKQNPWKFSPLHSLTHSMTTVVSLETKRASKQQEKENTSYRGSTLVGTIPPVSLLFMQIMA